MANANIKTPKNKNTEEGPGPSVEEQIDQQIDGSFPASDPPSYNAGRRIGRPKRPQEKAPADSHKRHK
jgi:hypothetical protein